MKQFLVCSSLFFVLCCLPTRATGIEVGLFGGLTLPSNEFGKAVFGNEQLLSYGSTPFGFHAGAECKIRLDDRIRLFGDISIHKIPNTKNSYVPIKQNGIQIAGVEDAINSVPYSASQVLVPITAGVEYSFLRLKNIDLFIAFGASVNYFSNDISLDKGYKLYFDFVEDGFRMGASGGLGAVIGLGGATSLELKAKYNCSNIVAKSPETTRNYFTVSAGLLFGI